MLMALAGLSTTASAETDSVFPPDIVPTGTLGNRTTFDDVLGRVYGFPGDGYAVIAGDSLEAVCTGAPPPVLPKMIKQNQSGTYDLDANGVPDFLAFRLAMQQLGGQN